MDRHSQRRAVRAAASGLFATSHFATSLFTLSLLLLLAMPASPVPAGADPAMDDPGTASWVSENVESEEAWLLRDVLHRVTAGRHLPPPVAAGPVRNADYDVVHYDIELTVDMNADTLAGVTAISIESMINGLTEVLLHLHGLDIYSIMLGTTPQAFTRTGEDVQVTLSQPMNIGTTFMLQVTYSGAPAHEAWGGFWFYYDMAFSIGVGLYTDPPSMGRYWFPCVDEPQDKALVTAHYTVPEGNYAVGNGLLYDVTPNPGNQTVTYHWDEPYPTATYLVAVAVADWRIVEDPVYPDLIYHYVLPGDSTGAVTSFQNVHTMMDAYTTFYSPYKYDKFSFVGVRIGDMEHQDCVSHLRALIGGNYYDPILAHELSHHWWGDWVTVADWRDIWLSEGFATHAEAIWKEHTGGMSAYHTYMNSSIMNYYLNSGETFPIYDPVNMWGATSYEKGACVLHMLRHVVGDAVFFQILDTWGDTYGFGNAVTPDFVAIASAEAGQDLNWFFDQWIYQAGYPRYEWYWRTSAGANTDTVFVHVDQVQTIGPVFEMPIDFRITTASGTTTMTAVVDQASQVVQFTLPEEPLAVAFDPDRWVLCRVEESTTGISTPAPAPRQDLAFCVAGPNPFAVATSMRLVTNDLATPVKVGVFDTSGRLVNTLHDDPVSAAETLIEWDGRNRAGHEAANGVYFMRAEQGGRAETHRIILLR